MFGMLPAYGFFIRHAAGIELSNVDIGYMKEDRRPPFVLESVKGVEVRHVKAQKAAGIPAVVLLNVENFATHGSSWLPPDTRVEKADRKEMGAE